MGYTAMGDFDGVSDDTLSDNLENKTVKPSEKVETEEDKYKKEAKQKVEQLNESNVLNGYRSITYNFILAGLNKNYLKDPTKYREGELDLVILKSGGKGTAGMKLSDSLLTTAIDLPSTATGGQGRGSADFAARDPRRLDLTDAQKAAPPKNYGQDFLDGFNNKSPGRFDMFIENIEVESVMSFTPESNTSLPTQIKFEVIEPYSINGFIEALQVAAIGAGYPSYLQASFLLKIEFWGYPDNQLVDESAPEKIPNSERYFPIGLTAIDVDITEKGTRYRCSAVPYNERAFGNPNTIKKPIKMTGFDVKSILTNLIDNLNSQVAKSDKEGKDVPENNQHDTYRIKFPTRDDTNGWVDSPENKIGSSKLVEIFKDNALYKMVDPSSVTKPNAYQTNGSTQPPPDKQAKQPESIKYTPGETVIQFNDGMNINDAITAVIRDSVYVRDMLKDVKKNIDEYGMLEYFLIKIETTNLDVIDTVSKKPFQEFCYVVTPYKVHYTRVPLYGSEQIEEAKLKKLSLREYNFIYTGKNIDVLSFKLNFNTLFFEAVPISGGNKDVPAVKTGAAATNGVELKSKGTDVKTQELNPVPLSPVKTVNTPVQPPGGSGSQPLDDPYSVMARNMHTAITDSKASMITGELEILGDPFFLVTGGIGNYNPKPDKTRRGKSEGGEAAHTYSELLITVNFRNPVDIQSLEEGGMMYFNPERVPFSGVYRINTVSHTFKDGVFKQRLQIMRVPGQILDQNTTPTDPADRTSTTAAPGDQAIPDTSPEVYQSQRLDDASAMDQLDRGLPSPGLPGELSNFTAAAGGLGGDSAALLNQSFGISPLSSALSAGSSVIGQSLPTDALSTVRLSSSGLAGLTQSALSSAALVSAASNVITNNLSINKVSTAIAGAIASSSLAAALNKSNLGSGIGEGATVRINPATVTLSPTMTDIRTGSLIDSFKLPAGSVSNISGIASSLSAPSMSAVQGSGSKISNLINGVGNNVNSLTASAADPSAIGARVGIDPSKLSGLSPNLQSNVLSQISSLAGSVQQNVNISQSVNAGLLLSQIPASKFQNIPPSAPYTSALPGNAPVAVSPSYTNNTVDSTVSRDKFNTAQSQLSGLSGMPNMPDSNIAGSVTSKFGSLSSGLSPLAKLISKTGLTS